MKTITFNYGGISLEFNTSLDVFSSAKIDQGTKILLNSLRKNPQIHYGNILDLGCGYGIIGIYLKKQYPGSTIIGVDRNQQAIELSQTNAQQNLVEATYNQHLGLEQQPEGYYDLITNNFPAKAGNKVLEQWLVNSTTYLTTRGIFALVIVNALTPQVEEIITKHHLTISYQERTKHYSVYHLIKTPQEPLTEDPYRRTIITHEGYTMHTVYGLAEFDTPNYATTQLINHLPPELKGKKVAIINPYQGHLPLSIIRRIKPKELTILTPDLLSLRTTQENLTQQKTSKIHLATTMTNITEHQEAIIFNALDSRDEEALEKILLAITPKTKRLMIAGKGNFLKRILKKNSLPYHILEQKKE